MPTPSRREQADEPEDQPTASEQPKAQPSGARYKVVSGGLTGAGGTAYYKGDELTAEQLGDAARIQKLLDKKAIEAIP